MDAKNVDVVIHQIPGHQRIAKVLPTTREAIGGNLPFAHKPLLLMQFLLHKKCISLPAFAFIIADRKIHVKYNLMVN